MADTAWLICQFSFSITRHWNKKKNPPASSVSLVSAVEWDEPPRQHVTILNENKLIGRQTENGDESVIVHPHSADVENSQIKAQTYYSFINCSIRTTQMQSILKMKNSQVNDIH